MLKADDVLLRSEKILAWFALLNGVLCMAFLIGNIFLRKVIAFDVFLICLVLGVLNLSAGYYGLKAKSWAFWLLFATFAFQLVEYFSNSFYFSFIGPFYLKFGFQWGQTRDHFSIINFNILAVVVCFYAVRAAHHLKRNNTQEN
ncbi:MAG: hypothetical protein PHP00_09035 [Thiotrichaceae bacterium]|nr:hypothetical protein [Thiotrichaceae bacterium]